MADEKEQNGLPPTDIADAVRKAQKKISDEALARRKRKAEMKRTKTPPGLLIDPIPPRDHYDPPLARLYCGTMYDIQQLRISTGNRILALDTTDKPLYDEMGRWLELEIYGRMNELEFRLEEMLASAVASLKIMKWLNQVPQVGPRLGGSFVGGLKDVTFFDTVASLWAQCGMSTVPVCTVCKKLAFSGSERVKFLNKQTARRWEINQTRKVEEVEERSDRPKEEVKILTEDEFREEWYKKSEENLCSCKVLDARDHGPDRRYYKGLLLSHSPFMKQTCWKQGMQFIKSANFYQRIYKESYAHYEEIWPHTSKDDMAHIGLAARRVIVKLFLSHLWEVWRSAAGLPHKDNYVQWKMSHDPDWAGHAYIDPPYTEGLSWFKPVPSQRKKLEQIKKEYE